MHGLRVLSFAVLVSGRLQLNDRDIDDPNGASSTSVQNSHTGGDDYVNYTPHNATSGSCVRFMFRVAVVRADDPIVQGPRGCWAFRALAIPWTGGL